MKPNIDARAESGTELAKTTKTLIVIINYNNYEDTRECIASCLQSGVSIDDILVVDNGSRATNVEPLGTDFPALNIMRLPENLGYSGGANFGFRHSIENGYDFSFLLNNDLVIDEDTIPRLMEVFETGKVGVAGPVNYTFGNDKVYFSGGEVDYKRGLVIHFDDMPSKPRETEFVTGSAMLIRNSLLKEIGLFDEGFFFYFEDADFSVRASRAGYKLVIHPQAKVRHKVGGTAGRNPKIFYYFQFNRLRFCKKNSPRKQLLSFLLFYSKELLSFGVDSVLGKSHSTGKSLYTYWALVDFIAGKKGKSSRI